MAAQNSPGEPGDEGFVERTVARVIVGFAGSRRGDALIDVAATYAQALRADLKGIYVRESELLDLAALPFTVALGPGRSSSQTLSASSLEQAWLREEATYRRAIAQRAGRQHIEWSCETTSGSFEACLQRTATRSDIVALSTETAGPTRALLMQGLADLARTARAVLLVGTAQAALRPGAILAIDDGGPLGEEIVRLSALIANATSEQLEVLRSDAPSTQQALGSALQARLHRGQDGQDKSLRAFLQQPRPSLVVASLRPGMLLDDANLRALMQQSGAPLLLVSA